MRVPHRVTAVLALLAAATVLTGCTAGGSSDSGSSIPDVAQVAPDASGARDEAAPTDRSLVSTASVALTSSDPATDTARIVTIVTDAGGRVDNRTDSPATLDAPAFGGR